jgi:DNA-binding CsgD family transcriptional regulator
VPAVGGHRPGTDEGEADLRLTVKSVALRLGQSTAVSFVFLQRKNVAAPVDHVPLSGREREIVAWVAEGMTNRQISELAFVSENTVHQHLKRVFRKLNVHSRTELVQAIRQGAADLP